MQTFTGKYMLDADKIIIDASGKTPPKFYWSEEPEMDEIVKSIGDFTTVRLAPPLIICFIPLFIIANKINLDLFTVVNTSFAFALFLVVFHPLLFHVYKNEKFWGWIQRTVFKFEDIFIPTWFFRKKYFHVAGRSKIKEIVIKTNQTLSSEWEVDGDYRKYLKEIEYKRQRNIIKERYEKKTPDVFMIFKFIKKPQSGFLKLWWR